MSYRELVLNKQTNLVCLTAGVSDVQFLKKSLILIQQLPFFWPNQRQGLKKQSWPITPGGNIHVFRNVGSCPQMV
jgi:hypothetical protein